MEEDEVIEDDDEPALSSYPVPPDPLVHGPAIARPVGPTTIKVGMNFGQLSLPKAPWISTRTTRYIYSLSVGVHELYYTHCMMCKCLLRELFCLLYYKMVPSPEYLCMYGLL